jgi:signal peptidase I
MAPTIQRGDRIGCTDDVPPEIPRGAVVVFDGPPRWGTATFVKRVVGLPGETVAGDADGGVRIDGTPLDEPYAAPVTVAAFEPVTVPAGEYFLMGDKRDASSDSRVNGTVPHTRLRGVCTRIVSPEERRGRIAGT